MLLLLHTLAIVLVVFILLLLLYYAIYYAICYAICYVICYDMLCYIRLVELATSFVMLGFFVFECLKCVSGLSTLE